MDIHLPVYDGWNVLTTLRKETNVPVIMVTALDQDVDKLMGLRLGADDYVIKPFNPSEVIAGLRLCFAEPDRLQSLHIHGL